MIIQQRPGGERIICKEDGSFLMEVKGSLPVGLEIIVKCPKCHREIKVKKSEVMKKV